MSTEFRELTAGQLGIWYAQQLVPESRAYLVGDYVAIHGTADVDVLVAAVRCALDEAAAYRLRFVVDGGLPRQYVDDSPDYPIQIVDVSSAPNPEAAAQSWMRMNLRRPLDPTGGPLYTQAVLKLGAERYFWYQRAHHLVIDGYSMSLFVGRVAAHYNALLDTGKPADGAPEPLSVLLDADAAYRASENVEADRRYWLGVLADLPETLLVKRNQRISMSTHDVTDIEPEYAQRLRAAARELKVSFAGMIIMAGAIYRHRTTGERDVVLGVPVLGRTGRRELHIPGMAANVVPVRLAVDTTVPDLARQTSTALRNALRHQRYQWVDLRRELKLGGGSIFGLIVNVFAAEPAPMFGASPSTVHSLASGPVDEVKINVYGGTQAGSFRIEVEVNPETTKESGAIILQNFLKTLNELIK